MAVYGAAGLTFYNRNKAHRGYTLFTPYASKNFYLIDMHGRFVYSWDIEYEAAMHGYLLPNGNLLYAGQLEEGPFPLEFGGSSGVLIELDWEGNEVWRYEDLFMHHDFYRMENGNTMILRFDAAPDDTAEKWKGGVPESERKGILWFSSFHEVDRDGNIVWEWDGCDHFDPEQDVINPLCPRCEFDHYNTCKVLPDGNILSSSLSLDNVYIIEKSSGDIIWRYGAAEEELSGPHDPSLLANGNILVFDNGLHRPCCPPAYSRVLEINRETREIVWIYQEASPVEFYASFISGCQRLSNDNTLICEGPKGRIFEVTASGEKVWEYINPFRNHVELFNIGNSNAVFRAHRYGPNFPGFEGKELDPKKYDWLNGVYDS